MNIHHEIDVSHMNDLRQLMSWCEQHFDHDWNVVADSGAQACRGDGSHTVTLLCASVDDCIKFKLAWVGEWPQ